MRRDPVRFLRKTYERHGPVFTLDLAGIDITLVADLKLLRSVLNAPEDRLSSQAALADFGFDVMLGPESLVQGTESHHALLTRERRQWAGDLTTRMGAAVGAAVRAELTQAAPRFEAFDTSRRVALRATLEALVDAELVARWPRFIDAFMRFQDRLEDATARAMALPRWLGVPLLLSPIARERNRLVAQLAPDLSGSGSLSPYVRCLRERLAPDPDGRVLANVVIGLLFAAHKNAALGAAQTLLFLLTHPEHLARVRAGDQDHLEHCVRETLRLTAHTLGAVRRVVHEPFVLGEFTLPVGARIGSAHILVTTDATHFAEPHRFHPDRFKERRATEAWIPFSAGVHGCPGQRVGMDLMQHIVTEILSARPNLGAVAKVPPLDFTRATLAQRAAPVMLQ